MDILIVLAALLTALIVFLWLGLRFKPPAFPPFADAPESSPKMVPLPSNLPLPVDRFYRAVYGETIPVILTLVLSGRGRMSPFGISLPMRFRCLYEVGQDYRAQIEMTFFRRPFLKSVETYIDGHGLGKMPSEIDEGPWFDDAMNVRIWCELLNWAPAALLSDPRVLWEPFDDESAVLVVPFGAGQHKILARFDPESGTLRYFEAMKYRTADTKMLWINGIWFDQGKPWITMDIEEKLINVEVHESIHG